MDLFLKYQIIRAAGQVETILGLAAQTKMDRPKKLQKGSASHFDRSETVDG
jgi:hypothetical protein